ncbi:MAG: DNA adenine methylase [Chloroflexota bacterium]
MGYPGGKGNLYQKIINLIPPHTTYIEPFLGGGAVALNKRPAQMNIGIDLDLEALRATAGDIVKSSDSGRHQSPDLTIGAATVISDDVTWWFQRQNALDFLANYSFQGGEFVYLDPPYLMKTRSSHRPLYRHEFATQKEHASLLGIIQELPCMVAISSYNSPLYKQYLSNWNTTCFDTYTRSGRPVKEYLWMNYPEPKRLHDYSHLGDNFRERERIKRKAERWADGLQRMPRLERLAIWSRLEELSL